MSTIEFRDISKYYVPHTPTLANVNLHIGSGEFCVFVGPSGCGKSTLLRMIAGLEEISGGEIYIDGQLVNHVSPADRGVAMVFQSYALYPHMTVRENMAFGLRVKGSKPQDIARKVEQAAQILQLDSLLERLPKQLSGGQRQRVAIGRAIVKEPKVFLFDEPLSNLDAALRVQTRLEIAKLHKDMGHASMVYVTHDQVEAMTLADKIVLLQTGSAVQTHGSIAQYGSPMDLYHRPQSLFVAEFIGSPKMNILPARFIASAGAGIRMRIGQQNIDAAVQPGPKQAGEQAIAIVPNAVLHAGVRPEHLRLCAPNSHNAFASTLLHLERLGESTLLYLDLGAGLPHIACKVEGDSQHKVGDTLWAGAEPEAWHVFAENGYAWTRTPELPV